MGKRALILSFTAVLLLANLFSCQPRSSFELLYEVKVAITAGYTSSLVKLGEQTNAYSTRIEYVTVKAVGEGVSIEESFTDTNSIVIRLPKGRYTLNINGYARGNSLYFRGSVDVSVPTNGEIIVPVKLVEGVLKVDVSLDDNNFYVKEISLNLVNEFSEEVKVVKFLPNNPGDVVQVQTQLEPGLWRVWAEVIAQNRSNEEDLRYSRSLSKILYVEPAKTTRGILRVRVPSTDEIGTLVKVSSVYDGDTFKDMSNVAYRVIGIDTPEISNTGTKPKGEYGEEAKSFFEGFVGNSNNFLRAIVKGTDAYGRRLAYVFDRFGKAFYEEEVTRNGLARVLFYDDTDVPSLSAKIKEGYRAAFISRKGVFSKWENAPEINKNTETKDEFVGKIIWLKGTVSSVSFEADKYVIILDDGWAKVEIRREEYIRMFESSPTLLEGKAAKFYGELWKEGGVYKILLRADFEYLVLD